MLNEANAVTPGAVIDYADAIVEKAMANGQVNTADDQILANIRSSIRRGYPQVRPQSKNTDAVLLIGSGPTLNDPGILDEIKERHFAGAKIVTMNGAYHWCLEHNLRPSTQIALDARPSNARFVTPAVPRCRYLLASQCAPELWDAVEGRPYVWIFHASTGATGPIKDLLDAYYLKRWYGVGGGVTVATRAISLLSALGYVRFDLFGVDSCWLEGVHHAMPQPENANDKMFTFTLEVPDDPGNRAVFRCSPWQLRQFEDFLQLIRVNSEHFLLHVHGRGLLATALRMLAASADGTLQHSVMENE